MTFTFERHIRQETYESACVRPTAERLVWRYSASLSRSRIGFVFNRLIASWADRPIVDDWAQAQNLS